jgi:hypothetical protein
MYGNREEWIEDTHKLRIANDRIARLRAALEWYSRPTNWKASGEGYGPIPANQDAGKRAHAALANEQEGK